MYTTLAEDVKKTLYMHRFSVFSVELLVCINTS